MSRHSRAAAIGSTVTRAGLAAGCGGAGSLAALALAHKAGAPALAAGAAVAVALNAAASACTLASGTAGSLSGLLAALIRARADAQATVIMAKVRAELARAGLDPARAPQAAEMQRALAVNPDLPRDRRPADETLLRLYGASRVRSTSTEPGSGPDTPGSRPKTARKVVVPLRSDQ
jgi:hypothetical protein